MMSRIRNSHSSKRVQALRVAPVGGTGDGASLFERISRQVSFAPADGKILQELSEAAQVGLTGAAAALEREVFGADETDGTWLPRVLAAPAEKICREAARGLREAAGRAAVPQALVVAALGSLPLRLEEAVRQAFGKSGRKGRAAQSAVGKMAAILAALLVEGAPAAGAEGVTAGASGQAHQPMGEACVALEGDDIYQLTLAKALLDSAPLGILAYDLYGRVTVCNTRVHEILGHELASGSDLRQWLGTAIEDPQDRQEAELHFAASFSSEVDGSASDTTLRVRRPDGSERVISLSSAAVRSPLGRNLGGITVITDATQQQQLEQNFIRAERMAAIGELAASLAHEIKNPLAGISGAMEIIKERFAPDDPHREIIDEILHQIKRLDSTVRDLLVYARPTPPDKMPTNLEELIDAVLTVLARERQLQPLQVIKHYPDVPAELGVDPDQLEQVFLNIVLNAAQAMDRPGQLVIRLGTEDGWCKVSFADNGPGMIQEVARRAFEPFFTTKTRGTGLGLSICRKIVEAHGGKMELKTALGEGTTITVKLPA
jgi:PAS domain S-box-containing protein